MSDTSTEKKIIIALFTALVFTGGAGAFCISIERQNKVEIANEIRINEQDISRLRRENEELSVKIATHESPAYLSARAGNLLVQPSNSGIVWAYENFRGGRVELKGFLLRHRRKLLSNEEK